MVQAGIQEMAENAVDSAHFRYVHNTAEVPEIEKYESVGHTAPSWSRARSSPRPAAWSTAASTSIADGPGVEHRPLQRHHRHAAGDAPRPRSTPTPPQTRFNFYVRSLGDEKTNSIVGEAFAAEVDKQFEEDMPIWEHKAHLVRPALADNDGPFMKFRKWYAQFYVGAGERRPHRLPAAVLAREDRRDPRQGHRQRQARQRRRRDRVEVAPPAPL